MDNVTHALAGLLLAESTVALASRRAPVSPGFRRAALVLGVACAELPDADLLYAGPMLGMGKLGYMLHHRGHTHTVVFALVGALVAWGIALLVARGVRARPHERRWLLGLAVTGTLVAHIGLDWTNSYGVHPFWPFDNRWYYGDSVFIVEPWLWVVAIPPLVFLERSVLVRVLLALALGGIVLAAWSIGAASVGVAVALTGATVLGLGMAFLARTVNPRRLLALAIVPWLLVEATFVTASRLARAKVVVAVGPTLEDASITPLVGNPVCWSAHVVERDGDAYRVTRATIALAPSVVPATGCQGGRGGAPVPMQRSARRDTRDIEWRLAYTASAGELASLARSHCEVAAALRFIRVPAWERRADGGARLVDLRYGDGFSELVVPARPSADRCRGPIPPWVPPRRALLRADAG